MTDDFAPIDWARRYHDVGFAPIPLWTPDECAAGRCSVDWHPHPDGNSHGKHPRVKWKDRPTEGAVTQDEVEDWWRRWPHAGIGLLTGARSGFDVIDVDPKNGGDLNAVLDLDGVDQATVRTGSGGWHVYLRHPGVDTTNGLADVIDLPGVDYRGDGGLVVAAPSQHASGAVYSVTDGADLTTLPSMPSWLVEAARGRAEAQAQAEREAAEVRRRLAENPPEQLRGRDATPYGAAVLDGAVRAIRAAEPGTPGTGRHDTTIARARVVGGYVASGEIEENAARQALLSAAVAVAGESRADEMGEAIDWGIELGKRQPLEKPDDDRHPVTLAPEPDRPTVTEGEEPDLAVLLDRYPDVPWAEVWDQGLDEPEWLIRGLVETRKSAAIFAAAGDGKSLVSLEMAACIATGTDFAGLPTRQADVLYVDAENDLGDVIDRLKTFGFEPDQLDRLHYKSLPGLPALDEAAGGQELVDLAKAHGAELVIIDTVARTVAGPEQDADTYRAYAKATGQKLKAAKIACWRIDHAGKDKTAGQRGSSAKNDDVDTVWQLDRDADQMWTLRTGTTRLKKRSRHGLTRLAVVRLDPTGLLSRREKVAPPTTLSEDDEVQQIIDLLDEEKIPLDWGRDRIRRKLNIAARNRVINTAIQARKDLSPLQTVGDRSGDRSLQIQNAVRDRSGTAGDSESGA